MAPFGECTLYLITDRSLSRGRSTAAVVREAVAGGVDVVQLREKQVETADVVREGLRVRDVTARCGVPLIVNDRIDVALAIEAEGAHVGQTDLPALMARKLLPPPALLGVSTSSVDMARCARQHQADYVGFGPIYPTATKETAASPRGTGAMQAVLRAIDIPLVALGGHFRSQRGRRHRRRCRPRRRVLGHRGRRRRAARRRRPEGKHAARAGQARRFLSRAM